MTERRRIDVFFYGLFMDEALLRAKGVEPLYGRFARVENFCLVIGARATLVPCLNSTVHGLLFSLTHNDLDSLYSEPSVAEYHPEAVIALTEDGSVPALCFNLPNAPSDSERNSEYAAKLKAVAQRIGLPAEYVKSI